MATGIQPDGSGRASRRSRNTIRVKPYAIRFPSRNARHTALSAPGGCMSTSGCSRQYRSSLRTCSGGPEGTSCTGQYRYPVSDQRNGFPKSPATHHHHRGYERLPPSAVRRAQVPGPLHRIDCSPAHICCPGSAARRPWAPLPGPELHQGCGEGVSSCQRHPVSALACSSRAWWGARVQTTGHPRTVAGDHAPQRLSGSSGSRTSCQRAAWSAGGVPGAGASRSRGPFGPPGASRASARRGVMTRSAPGSGRSRYVWWSWCPPGGRRWLSPHCRSPTAGRSSRRFGPAVKLAAEHVGPRPHRGRPTVEEHQLTFTNHCRNSVWAGPGLLAGRLPPHRPGSRLAADAGPGLEHRGLAGPGWLTRWTPMSW